VVNQKPSLNIAPIAITKNTGESLTFTLSPSGATPIAYQWLKNNIPIAGATDNTYLDSNVECTDAGVYSCSMSNVCGSISKLVSTVTVTNCGGYTIGGTVYYANTSQTPINSSMVYLETMEGVKKDSAVTGADGTYIIFNVADGSYKLVCSTTKAWGGADPLDALIINRTYVGSYTISDPLKQKAADVNNDTKINPADALSINRRYAGIIQKFGIPDWLFEETSVTVNGGNISQNIRAICAGDVNASKKNK
jgi:hypothetical protein